MARPNQEAIDTFMAITGATEAVAVRRLEEHGGDINEAVDAHFTIGDSNLDREAAISAPPDDFMDIDPFPLQTRGPSLPLLSAARAINPLSLLDASIGRSLFENSANVINDGPVVSHPREVREIPIEFKGDTHTSGHSGLGPTIEDVSGAVDTHVPESHGTVIIDDDDEENTPAATGAQAIIHDRDPRPSAPEQDVPDYSNDIEEEMIRAAIEASKQELRGSYPNQHGVRDDFSDPQPHQRQPHLEDTELAHAVSLSLKTAEEEKALRGQETQFGGPKGGALEPSMVNLGEIATSNGRLEVGSSSMQDEAEDEEEPLVRHRRGPLPLGSLESTNEIGEIEANSSSRIDHPGVGNQPQHNENAFPEEWGGISSEEHDEAVMLEAAMFGGIPEAPGHRFAYAPHQFMRPGGPYPRQTPHPPSPTLTAQRLIREQQDDEYLASLQADREKELKAQEEAEARRLKEEASRQAALDEERQREQELLRKVEEEEVFERKLAAKVASLPQEPASDDENAITLVVRMPDGGRRGRRFLKSDRLQSLFDFVDIGRTVKPGTYRLVRPYPRRAFSEGESGLTLNELGITTKQEALFLELI